MGLFDLFKKKKKLKKTKNLIFKSSEDAFQYTTKFFSNSRIELKSMYHGVILDSNGLAKICVLDKGEPVNTFVNVKNHPELKIEINKGDFVLIGISEFKNLMTPKRLEEIGKKYENDKNKLVVELASTLVKESPKGFVIYKLSLELDIASNQFLRIE
tara:strand:- start:17 stop:487 length:471 start_codon:yes stop_codon:yes gene_type:complete